MAAIIDASGASLGRLSSVLAKRLLEGEEIAVVNAEKAIIVGSKDEIEKRYRKKREVGGTKRKGPFFSRMPDKILKRTVRGMLPYQRPRGRKAYKNLKTYIGVPEEFEKEKFEKIKSGSSSRCITLKELSEYLGVSW
ncbi:MAG: 50S ribosomal protein L13 [Candidatus Thermoplasmatota archaeon]|nr:50S ribosomal protein L13 [Candidatus Thermoplasmatota archaeon]